MSRYATITVIGRDKTGVVARVTNLLFESRANIEALEEQVTRGQFSMTLQASWRVSQFDKKALGQRLQARGHEIGSYSKQRIHRLRFPRGRMDRQAFCAAVLASRWYSEFQGMR